MFSVLSLSIVLLFGLGWLIISPFLNQQPRTFLQEFPLALMCGISANYTIVLCVQSLRVSLLLSSFLALCGLWKLAENLRKKSQISYFSAHPLLWSGLIITILLYLMKMLSEPLAIGDGRWIWFFHAKMIYFQGALSQATGWNLPSVTFSHVDYPNLVPTLAAEVSYVAGYWNEYLPKFALVLMLIPPFCWVFSYLRRSINSIFLFCIVLFMIHCPGYGSLWDGYMDGFLALYLSIGLLLFGRYLLLSQSIDLVSSMGCLCLLPNLKNEGVLALLAGGGVLIITGIIALKQTRFHVPRFPIFRWVQWGSLFIGMLPALLWHGYYKTAWGLTNDLHIGTASSFERIFTRLTDGTSLLLIMAKIFQEIWLPVLLLVALFMVLFITKSRIPMTIFPLILTGMLYGFGIFTVYLLTPADLRWHLESSINRTMLPVSGCFFVGVFWIMEFLEKVE